MLAARLHEFGTRPALARVPTPEPGPGESLVRVEAAVVAHLDTTIASGGFAMAPPLPYTPGVEGAGTVVAGDGFPVGTRVAIRGGGVGMVRDGCWAEVVAAPDRALRPVPEGVAPELAAAFFVPLSTAYGALHDVGKFVPPEALLVTGASGAVGSLVVDLAIDAGAERVVAVVGRRSHAAACRRDERIDVVVGDGDALVAALDGRCPSLAVDTVGGPTLAAVLASVPRGGRVAVLGYTRGTDVTIHLPTFLLREVELRPVSGIGREARNRELAPHLAGLLAAGRVHLSVERFTLADIGAALDRLESGEAVGRVVVEPGT